VKAGWTIFFGMLTAIIAGIMLFPEEIDAIGDALVELTTSEETRLSQLEPTTQALVRQLIQTLVNQGLVVHIGQTLRTQAAEKAAIAAGKSAVKTHSWHEIGRAVDMYPINPDTGSPDMDGVRVDLFLQMQRTAESYGFRQIAFKDDNTKRLITNAKGKEIWDGGHMEYRGDYATIAEAVAAEGATYGIA
jgi:3D (Asp-Asp-Asp) domain-containing protein